MEWGEKTLQSIILVQLKGTKYRKLSKNNFPNGISYNKNSRGIVWLQL